MIEWIIYDTILIEILISITFTKLELITEKSIQQSSHLLWIPILWVWLLFKIKPETPIWVTFLAIYLSFNFKRWRILKQNMKIQFLFFVSVILVFYLVPSPLTPQIWIPTFKLPSIKDSNDILRYTNIVGKNVILAPESLAIDSDNGNILASLADGRVVVLKEEGQYIKTIFFRGQYIFHDYDLDQLSLDCTRKAITHELAWNKFKEEQCGRPLGLRIKKINEIKLLFIVDAYHGIYVIDMDKQTIHNIVTPTAMAVQMNKKIDKVALLVPKFFNDLDVATDGTIYFSDSSYKNTRSENRKEVLDGAPRGRIFSFKPKYFGGNGELNLMMCGLHFPNGVQLEDDDSLLVVESARFRVLKLNLNDEIYSTGSLLQSCDEYGSVYQYLKSKGSGLSILMDGAPGFMDNIRKGLKNNEYLIGVGAKSSKPFSLLYIAYQSNLLREIIGRIIPMKYIEYLVPKMGLILVMDSNGMITKTYQDPSGHTVYSISEAQFHPKTGSLLMGSHSNPFLGILTNDHHNDHH